MARAHVRLQFGMWRKGDHAAATKDERWLYTTILQDEAMNQCGVVVLRPSVWAEDAAMTDDEVAVALAGLAARRFVIVDERTRELLVRTYIRNDGVADQPNVLRNALAVAVQVRSTLLRRELAVELRRLPPPLPSRPTPSGRMFVYPDPHAVADELDPQGPPTGRERAPEHDPQTVDNPVDNPSNGRVPGRVERTHGRTPRGRGRGRGRGSPSVGGPVEGSRASHAPTQSHPHDDEPEQPALGLLGPVPAIPDRPPRCRRHHHVPDGIDPGPCRGCQEAREHWQRQQAEHRAVLADAARRAADGCTDCSGTGWRELPPLSATSQARAVRCDHRPVQSVPSDARGRPA